MTLPWDHRNALSYKAWPAHNPPLDQPQQGLGDDDMSWVYSNECVFAICDECCAVKAPTPRRVRGTEPSCINIESAHTVKSDKNNSTLRLRHNDIRISVRLPSIYCVHLHPHALAANSFSLPCDAEQYPRAVTRTRAALGTSLPQLVRSSCPH